MRPMWNPVALRPGPLSNVRGMSSPEAFKVGAFGHAISPLNY